MVVEANVTETLTGQPSLIHHLSCITASLAVSLIRWLPAGIVRPGKAEVKAFAAAEQLEYLDSTPTSFKPGLSYTGFVSRQLLISIRLCLGCRL